MTYTRSKSRKPAGRKAGTEDTERFDLYKVVTDEMIKLLDAGTVPWHQPWATQSGFPLSLSTRRGYRGVNVLLLGMQAMAQGYRSPWWGTEKKIMELDGVDPKGDWKTVRQPWRESTEREPHSGTHAQWQDLSPSNRRRTVAGLSRTAPPDMRFAARPDR